MMVLLLSQSAVADRGDEREAHAAYLRGLEHYNAGRYAAALAEFEAGYRRRPIPLFLFNAAQAARRGGQREKAIELYRQFLALAPDAPQRSETQHQLALLEPPPATTVPQPTPTPEIATAPPVTTAPPLTTAPPVMTAPPITTALTPTPTTAPPQRDKLGGALTGLGVAATVAGAILVAIGGAAVDDANGSYAKFDAGHRAQPMLWGGGATLGAGLLLVVAGAVRYAVVIRSRK
jgi:tetratricopeptide (TPR) repeat protein